MDKVKVEALNKVDMLVFLLLEHLTRNNEVISTGLRHRVALMEAKIASLYPGIE